MFYLFLVIVFNILIRWLVSLNNYSGYNKPPMYGDFEAQRHWMEITYNLPHDEWYKNTSNNDLLYWGLDYPPLTAYHSLLMGYLSNKINPNWVELEKSRGITNLDQKLFMRYTVLFSDILIYITAITFFWYLCSKEIKSNWIVILLLNLLYPGLILIDHGHFQYNCISLGLFLWAINFIKMDNLYISATLFSLALNYKQMELYHALPMFAYLLGHCIKNYMDKNYVKDKIWHTLPSISNEDIGGMEKNKFEKIKKWISIATILTFLICWYPFIWNKEMFMDVLKRLFPFGRGLYEDKVANFWCTVSVVIKFREIFTQAQLIIISALLTLTGSAPSFLKCLTEPTLENLKLALVNTSIAFFLFSFQVHEKSVLLAATPIMLLLPDHPYSCLNFLMVSCFSMYPLFVKDNLVLPFYATFVMYFLVVAREWLNSRSADDDQFRHKRLLYRASMIVGVVTCLASHVFPAPARYPDLWAVLICAYSYLHFSYYLAYFNHQIWFGIRGADAKKLA